MATLKEIAAAAGVNVSTVSRALSGHPAISPETRELVRETARRLGYRPKTAPRTIGVIVPEVAGGFYTALVHELEACIRREGCAMLVAVSGYSGRRLGECFETMQRLAVRGILCSSACTGRQPPPPAGLRAPVVFLEEGGGPPPGFDCVEIPSRAGAELAVEHLLALGHARFGFIGDAFSSRRLESLASVLGERGFEIPSAHIKTGPERFEAGGYAGMRALLAEREQPTAVFAACDQLALGALRALREAGRAAPGELSLMGFGNIAAGRYLAERLTTVSHPVEAMGRTAAGLLFARLAGGHDGVVRHIQLMPALVAGETTGPAQPKQP